MCIVCERVESELSTANVTRPSGAIAQLVERFHGMEEVRGSIPLAPLSSVRAASHRSGFVARRADRRRGVLHGRPARTRVDGSPRLRFRFTPDDGRPRPAAARRRLRRFIGVGSIQHEPARSARAGSRPSTYAVAAGRASASRSSRSATRTCIAGAQAHAVPATGASSFHEYEARFPSNWGAGHPPAPSPAARSRCEDGGSAVSTTTRRPATEVAAYLGGFVAAEGCFHARPETGGSRSPSRSVPATGRWSSCSTSSSGAAASRRYGRRQPHYDDEVTFVVRRLRDLVEVVVPFMDEHLPPRTSATSTSAGGPRCSTTGSTALAGDGSARSPAATAPAGQGPVPAPLLRGVRVLTLAGRPAGGSLVQ